jgi:hypothetical protein
MVTESVKGNAVGFVQVASHVLKTKGILGFYSGLIPRIISTTVLLLGTEFILQKFN